MLVPFVDAMASAVLMPVAATVLVPAEPPAAALVLAPTARTVLVPAEDATGLAWTPRTVLVPVAEPSAVRVTASGPRRAGDRLLGCDGCGGMRNMKVDIAALRGL